ncbi:MAG: DUF6916 family protein [Pyrinomonadaceae bacterium]
MEKTVFLPLLHTEFQVHAGNSEPVPLTLVEVSDLMRTLGGEPRRGKRGFSLMFKGARTHFLPQSMYRIEHEALGTFELFLVPIVPDDDQSFSYEAIFNSI